MAGMEASKTTQNKFFSLVVIFFSLQLGFTHSAFAEETSSVSKTTKNKEFTKPVYFDVLGGSDMPEPTIVYSLEANGSRLVLGPVTIDEKTFAFGFRKLNEVDPNWPATGESYFFIRWPSFLFTETVVELLTRDGSVIWKREITTEDLQAWKNKTPSASKGKGSKNLKINWAIEAKEANLPLKGLADGFRFCLSPRQENAQERLCSQSYVVRQAGTQTLLGRLKDSVPSRILVNAEVAPEKGEVKAEAGMPIRFFSELSTGETLEFTSRPRVVAWSDATKLEGKDLYTVVGFDRPPSGAYRIINPDRFPGWVEAIGFQPTIYDPRKYWAVRVKTQEPFLFFQGETGGIFKHPLPVDKIPSSKLRLYLGKNVPKGTYRDGVKIKGRKQSTSSVSSQEYKIQSIPNSNEFTWSFKAQENARSNRSSILISDGGQTYKSYFEIYKGFSNELSGRLSMILSTSGLILMGEAAYNLWFEDILGWDNYWFSKQRWGISTKYFQSVTKYEVKGFGDAALNVVNVDLKYRLTPGLWTRDESHGLMTSYQNVDVKLPITDFKVPMVGFGWFWARSMPKVFDEIFSLLPYMDYPKWVDMEFIYYATSMDSSKKLNFNFALNFHGQVLWKDNFFGEAGFGIKRYDFVDVTNSFQSNLGYQLNTLYGTVGMGLKF